jgi:hypothetical protein
MLKERILKHLHESYATIENTTPNGWAVPNKGAGIRIQAQGCPIPSTPTAKAFSSAVLGCTLSPSQSYHINFLSQPPAL